MPSFGLKRRGKKRRAAAAAEEERLSRSNSEYSSDDDTSEREKSKETIRHTVNPYSQASTTGQSWSERIFGKGFKTKSRRRKVQSRLNATKCVCKDKRCFRRNSTTKTLWFNKI